MKAASSILLITYVYYFRVSPSATALSSNHHRLSSDQFRERMGLHARTSSVRSSSSFCWRRKYITPATSGSGRSSIMKPIFEENVNSLPFLIVNPSPGSAISASVSYTCLPSFSTAPGVDDVLVHDCPATNSVLCHQ